MHGKIFQIDLNSGTGYIISGLRFIPFDFESFSKNLDTELKIGDDVSFLFKYKANSNPYAYEIDTDTTYEGIYIPENTFNKVNFNKKIHKMIGTFKIKSRWRSSPQNSLNEINFIYLNSQFYSNSFYF